MAGSFSLRCTGSGSLPTAEQRLRPAPLTALRAVQGRARPSLAALYNWRYTDLGNLPIVEQQPEYRVSNAALAYDYQLVDVPDGEESAPLPYFYQVLPVHACAGQAACAGLSAARHTAQPCRACSC